LTETFKKRTLQDIISETRYIKSSMFDSQPCPINIYPISIGKDIAVGPFFIRNMLNSDNFILPIDILHIVNAVVLKVCPHALVQVQSVRYEYHITGHDPHGYNPVNYQRH